jgi:hypothetical protein
MSDLREPVVSGFSRTLEGRLQEADPIAEEGPLSDADAQRMRRVVVKTARERTSAHFVAWKTSWAALTIVVAVSAVLGIAHWREPRVNAPVAATHETSRATSDPPRQVHFVAPGGTRVIWIFNPDFKP